MNTNEAKGNSSEPKVTLRLTSGSQKGNVLIPEKAGNCEKQDAYRINPNIPMNDCVKLIEAL